MNSIRTSVAALLLAQFCLTSSVSQGAECSSGICSRILNMCMQLVGKGYSNSKPPATPQPLSEQQQLDFARERAELVAKGFDDAEPTETEVEVYGPLIGLTAGTDWTDPGTVHKAVKNINVSDKFLPASLRDPYLLKNILAPGHLTLKNVDQRVVEHYFFTEAQVEIPKIQSAFSKVIQFGPGGTGVLISNKGHFLTARHVFKSIFDPHGRHAARLEGRNANSIYFNGKAYNEWGRLPLPAEFDQLDLAIVRIPELAGIDPVRLAVKSPSASSTIYAIGFPEIYADGRSFMSETPLLSVGRVFSSSTPGYLISNAEVRSGNSGGPQLDSNGDLVAITTRGGMGSYTTNANAVGWDNIFALLTRMGLLNVKDDL